MPTARRNRRVPSGTIWGCIAVALLIHAFFLGSVEALGLDIAGRGFVTGTSSKPADPDVELQTSCSGDVLLATSARAVMCLAPWRGDVEGCTEDLEMNMWMDLSSCRGKPSDAIAAVAMMTPREVEKLKPIDPEPLIEELKQKEEEK